MWDETSIAFARLPSIFFAAAAVAIVVAAAKRIAPRTPSANVATSRPTSYCVTIDVCQRMGCSVKRSIVTMWCADFSQSRARSAMTVVVLPFPEGAATTTNPERESPKTATAFGNISECKAGSSIGKSRRARRTPPREREA